MFSIANDKNNIESRSLHTIVALYSCAELSKCHKNFSKTSRNVVYTFYQSIFYHLMIVRSMPPNGRIKKQFAKNLTTVQKTVITPFYRYNNGRVLFIMILEKILYDLSLFPD